MMGDYRDACDELAEACVDNRNEPFPSHAMVEVYVSSLRAALAPPETIVSAAIKYGDLIGSVPAPGRHHDVIRAWADRARLVTRGKDEQGFTTSTGRFVGREEAMQIAVAAGQVDPKNRKIDTGSPDLFSEDLW
jgi:hypothetical protein